MKKTKSALWLGGCGCLLIVLLVGMLVVLGAVLVRKEQVPPAPTVISASAFPTSKPASARPTLLPQPTASKAFASALAITQRSLQNRRVPSSDPVSLAKRLWHVAETWATPARPPVYHVGAHASFWVTNNDTSQTFKVNTTLAAYLPHVYLWVGDNVHYRQEDAEALVTTFEDKIYPTDRSFFGSEWTPGIDGDPHIYIVFVRGVGSSVAGYFSSADELPPFAHKFSNAHEMFVLNADVLSLNSPFTYGVLAHEFQHMIHWYHDRNETAWLNEGASELATWLNHYSNGGVAEVYMGNPDIQLNAWADPALHQSTVPHYGASFLFLLYFLGRFGDEATRTLIARPENGMLSVDLTLHEIHSPENADDVFVDWVLTDYLRRLPGHGGIYSYKNYSPPKTSPTSIVKRCPAAGDETVHQYGVDYIKFACPGEHTVQFKGDLLVPLFSAKPHSGELLFWSGYGDGSDMSLTREFDLSGVSSATLDYWLWYDIEKDYDFLYVEASRDGRFWDILKTPSGTDHNPTGNNYGWGYTGVSGQGESPKWIHESVDLSPYAGGKVWVRFEYVTDAAVNHTGVLLDDIALPQIGYSADFEEDDGGWQARGFARVGRYIPQRFRVEMVFITSTGVRVQPISLNSHNEGKAAFTLRKGESATLVVSGVNRHTREVAHYSWKVH